MTKQLVISGNIKLTDSTLTETDVSSEAISIAETYTEVTVQDVSVAAAATDQALNFGGVGSDAPLLIIVPTYTDGGEEYMTAKVNGGTDNIPFGKMLVLGGNGTGIDSITVTNPDSSNSVQLKFYVCS